MGKDTTLGGSLAGLQTVFLGTPAERSRYTAEVYIVGLTPGTMWELRWAWAFTDSAQTGTIHLDGNRPQPCGSTTPSMSSKKSWPNGGETLACGQRAVDQHSCSARMCAEVRTV